MNLPSLYVLLFYFSTYLFLIFSAICLACGLMYCVELAEEHTSLTRKILRFLILFQLLLHPLLLFYERFPILPTSLGFFSHLSYLLLLQTFPYIQLSSPNALLSLALFILSNVFYFRFFTSRDNDLFYVYRIAPIQGIAAFFLIAIWIVPLGFFVSLTVNDSVLPGAGVDEPMRGKKKKSKSIVKVIGDALRGLMGGDGNGGKQKGMYQNLQF